MGVETAISWTDSTFNPWWGCQKCGPGCDNCYADVFDRRTGGDHWGADAEYRTFGDKHWNEPMKWNAKAMAAGRRWLVFCASMGDVFDRRAPAAERERLWALIRATPALTWIIVTKRIGNAPKMLPADWGGGYPNVWLLSTVVNQDEADRDIPKLLAVPARVHGLSMEPLLGPVDLRAHLDGLGWIIVGGESGHHARPLDLAWVRDLRDQAQTAGKAFFFKQAGGRGHEKGGCLLDGIETKEWPLAS